MMNIAPHGFIAVKQSLRPNVLGVNAFAKCIGSIITGNSIPGIHPDNLPIHIINRTVHLISCAVITKGIAY